MTNQQGRGGRGAGSASDRVTKAEKKEQARLEREAIQRQMAARKRTRTIGLLVGVAAAVVVGVLIVSLSGGSDPAEPGDDTANGALPGLLTTPGPWPANNELLGERLEQLDFPAFLDQEGQGQHLHTRVWIYVGGEPFEVPESMGFDQARGVASPLHTHDPTGLVHVESADPTWAPTVGNLFDSWGVRLSSTCLGGNCAADELRLRAFVDGEEWEGDPREIPLEDQHGYVLVFGSDDQLPDPLPDSFTFTGA